MRAVFPANFEISNGDLYGRKLILYGKYQFELINCPIWN